MERIERDRSTKEYLEKSLSDSKDAITELEEDIVDRIKVRTILQQVAQDIQSSFKVRLSEIVTLALCTIFDETYIFNIDFVQKRNKTETEIYIMKGDVRLSPLDSMGGGVLQVISFALRLSLFLLKTPRLRNTIILDEPFSFLSKDHQEKAGELLLTLSKKLGIQFIVVTHSDFMVGDSTFEVINTNNISKVLEL